MKKDYKPQTSTTTATPNNKKRYEKPCLKPLGDIRDVTMGGSPGTGDSGNASIQRF